LMMMTKMGWWWAYSDRQDACERCATRPRQQSTNGDCWGRRRWERGAILGDGTSKEGQGGGGGKLVEESLELELRKIAFTHTFRPPQSTKHMHSR
jgi:hypothetical protein